MNGAHLLPHTHTHIHTGAEKPGDMHRQTAETGVEAASLWPRLEAGVGAEARGESRVKNMFGYNSSFMFFVACLLHIPCSYKGSSTGCFSCEWNTKN